MKQVAIKSFTNQDHQTWKTLFDHLADQRRQQIVPLFSKGLKDLGIEAQKIPDIENVNSRLRKLTGWEGVPVEGLEEGIDFFHMLSKKLFPIGHFIRDVADLSYTPAPDIFHDLYGHIPFYADSRYAEHSQEYGRRACLAQNSKNKVREFERFFWFTNEFGLVETPKGRRIFGAGIVSSRGECEYALGPKPEVLTFDIERIRQQEFRIDVFQEKLFVMKNPEQLYDSLDLFFKEE